MNSSSSLGALNPDDKKKLDNFMDAAKAQLQEIDDRRSALNDLAKNVAEELGLKPKRLMVAARTAYKNNLADKREEIDTVADILEVTGNA